MAKKINILSQYTKDEILNAIESECEYCTQRLIASFCELERAKQYEKKVAENIKRVEQARQAYSTEYQRLKDKYGDIQKISDPERLHLCELQGNFIRALKDN